MSNTNSAAPINFLGNAPASSSLPSSRASPSRGVDAVIGDDGDFLRAYGTPAWPQTVGNVSGSQRRIPGAINDDSLDVLGDPDSLPDALFTAVATILLSAMAEEASAAEN